MNYTVFDIETANAQRDSICAIGIIRYENDTIIFEKEILINPEVEFNSFNTRIHGITARDVADAPTFPQVWPEISQYFQNTILVAHNAKSIDLCALYRTLERYDLPLVENDYICTMELAKNIFKNDDSEQSYRIDVLAKKYEIDLFHHHDALEDTRACFEILKKFAEVFPKAVQAQHYYYTKFSKCGCAGANAIEGIFSDRTGKLVSV